MLVVGDEHVLTVHLRTTRADLALHVGHSFGTLADIVVRAAPAAS
jgi:dihydroxyacetone kinase-like predicted kinase